MSAGARAALGVEVEVLAVGDELLAGDITNGNAAWLSSRLADAGVPVTRHVTVADDVDVIAAAVLESLGRVAAVVVTGGLGPTQDDLTREGLALAAGVGVRREPGLEAALRAAFSSRGRTVPEMNYRMADLPVGASSIPNPTGAAPGVLLELPGPGGGPGVVYALPGVPGEMRAMVEASVAADLVARMPAPQAVVARTVRTAGLWESEVAQAMAPEVERARSAGGPVVAFLASGGQTRVKVTGTAPTVTEAEALVAPVVAFARRVLGDAVVGGGVGGAGAVVVDDSLEGVVVAMLRARGETLAVAESLTGGLLAGRLTDVAGASDVFVGGVTAYATRLKGSLLGVAPDVLAREGAVSPVTAVAMARGVRERLGSSWGLATTGVAGPSEQEGHPVGTVHVALAGPSGAVVTKALTLPGDRGHVRLLAVVAALDVLRRTVLQRTVLQRGTKRGSTGAGLESTA